MAKDTYETHDEFEKPKDGLGNGLIVLTTIILIVAFVVIQKAMAHKFDAGMFGTGKTAGTPGPAPAPGPAK